MKQESSPSRSCWGNCRCSGARERQESIKPPGDDAVSELAGEAQQQRQ